MGDISTLSSSALLGGKNAQAAGEQAQLEVVILSNKNDQN